MNNTQTVVYADDKVALARRTGSPEEAAKTVDVRELVMNQSDQNK